MSEALPPNLLLGEGLQPDASAFNIADVAALSALADAEERHFWFRSRNRFIASRLASLGVTPPARVLELGCGGGAVVRHLARAGYQVTGVEGHAELARLAAARAPDATVFVQDLAAGEPSGLGGGFDAVALFDVIEHLDRPELALERALARTRPGGFVVGTVPALMGLWSSVDVHAGHRLRYDAVTLSGLLTGLPGARDAAVLPFNRVLIPSLWLQRRWLGRRADAGAARENLRVPPRPVDLVLYALVRAEHLLAPGLDRLRIPGASLWFQLRRG